MEKQELGSPRTVEEIKKCRSWLNFGLIGISLVSGLFGMIAVLASAGVFGELKISNLNAIGVMCTAATGLVITAIMLMDELSKTTSASTKDLAGLSPYANDEELVRYLAKVSEMGRDVLLEDVSKLTGYLEPKFENAKRAEVLQTLSQPPRLRNES